MELQEKLIKIAEQKIRNTSYLFNLDKMEKALEVLRNCKFVSNNPDTFPEAFAVAYGNRRIELYPPYLFLSPLEQINTLIHEFTHIYLSLLNVELKDHNKNFLGVYRHIIRKNYKHHFVTTTQCYSAGGFRYALQHNLPSREKGHGVFCPKCKKEVIITNEYPICEVCNYKFA